MAKPYEIEYLSKNLPDMNSYSGLCEIRILEEQTRICSYEAHYLTGLLHRDQAEGAALILRDRVTGEVTKQTYYHMGAVHRDFDEGPAEIEEIDDGRVMMTYRWMDKIHRDENLGPAQIEQDKGTRRILAMRYFRDSRLHRRNGPAVLEFDLKTGKVTEERYYSNGQLHRHPTKGPAIIERDGEGNLVRAAYYSRSKEIKAEIFDPPLSPKDARNKHLVAPARPIIPLPAWAKARSDLG